MVTGILDRLSGILESRGLIKLAYDLDRVSDAIDQAAVGRMVDDIYSSYDKALKETFESFKKYAPKDIKVKIAPVYPGDPVKVVHLIKGDVDVTLQPWPKDNKDFSPSMNKDYKSLAINRTKGSEEPWRDIPHRIDRNNVSKIKYLLASL